MAAAPVAAVSTEYPSSTKFCRRESAIVGSSSTTRIRTSLFSTFFSSLEIAAPWGILGYSFFIHCRFRLAIEFSKWKLNYKFLIYEFCRPAVGLDYLCSQRQFYFVAAGE